MIKILFLTFIFASLGLGIACSSSPEKNEASKIPKYDESEFASGSPQSTNDLINKSAKDEFPEEEKSDSEKKKIVAENFSKFTQALKTRQYKAANDIAGDILAKNPKDNRALNGLAVVAIEQGKLELARMYLSKILASEQLSAAYNNLGVIELRSDNLRLALIDFKKAVELDSSNKTAHANLGSIYLQYRNYEAAADQLQLAANNGEETNAVYSNLGFALRGVGRYEDARDAYEKALTKDESNTTTLYNYAVLLFEYEHDKTKAMKIVNKLRMVAKEPAILEKTNLLVKNAEAKEKNGKTP